MSCSSWWVQVLGRFWELDWCVGQVPTYKSYMQVAVLVLQKSIGATMLCASPWKSSSIISPVLLAQCVYHTSHSESLEVTDRMEVPVSARSARLDTLVVGLAAAVEGDSAELCVGQPGSANDLMPLCPMD